MPTDCGPARPRSAPGRRGRPGSRGSGRRARAPPARPACPAPRAPARGPRAGRARRGRPGWPAPAAWEPRGPRSRRRFAELALGALEHLDAALVAPLVLAHPAGGGLVGVAHPLGDVARREVVVARERLVLLEALGLVDDRGALAVGALVGDDLAELVLGEVRELGDGLARGQLVVVGERRLRLADAGAARGPRRRAPRGARRGGRGRAARRRAGLALRPRRAALGAPARGAGGVGRARGLPVVAGLAAGARLHDRVREAGDEAAQLLEHALLLPAMARRELGGGLVSDGERELLEGVVDPDLERLGDDLVAGVLEQLLLALGAAAQQVERPLGEDERLPDDRGGEAVGGGEDAAVAADLPDPAGDRALVLLGLGEMALQQVAVGPAGGHRDVGAEVGDQGLLGGVRLLQVLEDHGAAGLGLRGVVGIDLGLRGHGAGLTSAPPTQTRVRPPRTNGYRRVACPSAWRSTSTGGGCPSRTSTRSSIPRRGSPRGR